MAIQYSVAVRNARLDATETAIGASPIMEIRSGPPPANCAAAATGTLLASLNLPADFMANASGGTKAKSGTWSDAAADGTGVAGHFRIKDSAGTTCHAQGTVGLAGSRPDGTDPDLVVDNVNFNAGQGFTVNTFSLTGGGA